MARLLINDIDGIQKIIQVGTGGLFMPLEPSRTLADETKNPGLDWTDIQSKLGGLSGSNGVLTFKQSDKDANVSAKQTLDSAASAIKTAATDRDARLLAAIGKPTGSSDDAWSLIQDLIKSRMCK